MEPLLGVLGTEPADGELYRTSYEYLQIIAIGTPFIMISYILNYYLRNAGSEKLASFAFTVGNIVDIVLNIILVLVVRMGVRGAALATISSQIIGSTISLIYFAINRKSLLRLTGLKVDFKSLGKACWNGSSELMSNISMNLVGVLYNFQLLKYIGEDGVSAYGVLMYVCMIFLSIFIGFSIGSAPIIGYNYGAKNDSELQNVYKKSMLFIIVSSIVMTGLSIVLASPFSKLYVGYDTQLFELTKKAFYIYSVSYLFSGIAIFVSSFFTALNNGLISAIISFLRTLIFQVIAILVFPLIWGVDGIWWSVVFAEAMAFVVSIIFLIVKKKKYRY